MVLVALLHTVALLTVRAAGSVAQTGAVHTHRSSFFAGHKFKLLAVPGLDPRGAFGKIIAVFLAQRRRADCVDISNLFLMFFCFLFLGQKTTVRTHSAA